MTALAEDTQRAFMMGIEPILMDHPALTGTIFIGSAVIVDQAADTGFAAPLTFNADHKFAGFADTHVEAAADGEERVRVRSQGALLLTTTELAADPEDVGQTVYMDDDGDGFTLTSTNAVRIGKVANVDEERGIVRVAFKAESLI